MKIAQLRAIGYAARKAMREKQREYLTNNGLYEEYCASKYKTMTWFLKSKNIVIR